MRCCLVAVAMFACVRSAAAVLPSLGETPNAPPSLPSIFPAVRQPKTRAYTNDVGESIVPFMQDEPATVGTPSVRPSRLGNSPAARQNMARAEINDVCESILPAEHAAPAASTCPCRDACCFANGCCCDPCGTPIGGVGLYLIQPFFTNNPAVTFFRQGTGPGFREDIRQHLGAAPLFWVGYMFDSGLGVRARWWFFRQGTEQSWTLNQPDIGTMTTVSAAPLGSVIIADNAQAFAVTSKLQLHVVDLEGFQDATFGNWNLLFAGGLGFTDIHQNYSAYVLGAPGAKNIPLLSSRHFSGLGPVMALEARRQLADSGFNLYSSARGRILFGSSEQLVTGGPELNGAQRSGQSAFLPIGELELGLEYARMFGQQSRLFGQVAMIGQEWLGAGNASGAVRGGPPTTIPIFGSEDHSNLGFFGVSFRLGVNY